MFSLLQASVFIGKNYSENLHSIKNTGKDLTMKRMFDIFEKLMGGQSDEIYGVNTTNWEDSSWEHLFLIDDEEVVSPLAQQKFTYFQILYCVLER